MKKTKLINSEVSSLIANLGHTERICICDAGLPIPDNIVSKIDLAVSLGIPNFWDVLDAINSEAQFEKVIIAQEIQEYFPNFIHKIKKKLGEKCEVELVKHQDLKKITTSTKAIIRTGHNEWYHNVILQSGVTF